jgi:hypothetical protein
MRLETCNKFYLDFVFSEYDLQINKKLLIHYIQYLSSLLDYIIIQHATKESYKITITILLSEQGGQTGEKNW